MMNQERTIRWGMMSTARINRRMIPAIRSTRHGQVVAVASRDGGRAEWYSKEWGIPQFFGSYQALLEDSSLDAGAGEEGEMYRLEIENFQEVVLGRGEAEISWDETRNNIKVLTALHQSAREGRDVGLPLARIGDQEGKP